MPFTFLGFICSVLFFLLICFVISKIISMNEKINYKNLLKGKIGYRFKWCADFKKWRITKFGGGCKYKVDYQPNRGGWVILSDGFIRKNKIKNIEVRVVPKEITDQIEPVEKTVAEVSFLETLKDK